ncbi:saponin hydrolase precursor [Plectosphaerella cucumerina]|uniref:Saponin hydrolase n=1 Tax=Plectosphaerella cucumerina TaxID=40658 RepID=A0A8K0T8H2_9PEZI|nr:saponin hydrolase precursor [Plectosphaerella cucumerina]
MRLPAFVAFLSATATTQKAQHPLLYDPDADSDISGFPPPPEPEPIAVRELPLPPVAPSTAPGACSKDINPSGTGCIARDIEFYDFQAGGFLPDNRHVVVKVPFVGAPESQDPSSIYTGVQLILVKTDNTTFPNGDAWKCITCGVPTGNAAGSTGRWEYPQPFHDGRRILAGDNIIECDFDLASNDCSPEHVEIIPLRWNTAVDGAGPGGAMRELRLHPDNLHIGWSSFDFSTGRIGQVCYFGKLAFNPAPKEGEPAVRRYDVEEVTILLDATGKQPMEVDPKDPTVLTIDPTAIAVGELRGFSGDGREATYVGYPEESSNIDVFAIDLFNGTVRRLTSHPEYVDPVDISPDSQWTVVMDTRGTGRQMFLSGLRHVPPLTDIVTAAATSSVRNNGHRRFFQPWLIDRHGDRGSYFGQRVNAAGDGVPGNGDINDPEWNGMADPKWSPDGTQIVYGQALTVAPACGGHNPLPCHKSTAQGGRTMRVMLANLTSREPQPRRTVDPVPDSVPWGIPYTPGKKLPDLLSIAAGNYTLKGRSSGWANVTITNDARDLPESVAVIYHEFSDDGRNFLRGREYVKVSYPTPMLAKVVWFSDLAQTGPAGGTKKTSPDGLRFTIDVSLNVFEANGTLTTTIGGIEYRQPANRT